MSKMPFAERILFCYQEPVAPPPKKLPPLLLLEELSPNELLLEELSEDELLVGILPKLRDSLAVLGRVEARLP